MGRLVAKAANHLTKLTNQGQAYHDAWNHSAVHLIKASEVRELSSTWVKLHPRYDSKYKYIF